ncbi:glycosyltransferase [Chryseobacterium tongliaoense]|uniref:glycosyltransferase n=1 Tax=Chryseobacterium tongliaoense TaxID=3240933 RepID=UPI003511CA26
MISIIVSSYQEHYYNQLIKNIDETIGPCQYEIIQVWNPALMGITKAYNLGASKAKYEYLLFIHEDIIFHTQKWGEKLISHLKERQVGIIGVSGSSYVPTAPSSWTVSIEYQRTNILESTKEQPVPRHTKTTLGNRNEVYGVDGVFLAIKKTDFIIYKFNEDLKGFHGYDLDLSLRVSKTLQNYVVDDILIEHFSMGNRDKTWFDTNIAIRENLGSKFNKKNSKTETKAFLSFLYNYFKYYPVNKKNIFFTLKFHPFKSLNISENILILKKYFNYIKYSLQLNKKHK